MTVDEQRVFFPSGEPAMRLEGRLHLPAEGHPVPGAVVCHPYPPGGGSLLVKVVRAVARRLADDGVAALRFNFRGVGASDGRFDEGRGEVDDVAGALSWLAARPEVDAGRLALVGYSFGALMSLAQGERDARPRALALIGLPLSWGPALPTPDPRPWLLLAGDRDEYCPANELRELAEELGRDPHQGPVTLEVIDDTDHFFIGHEDEVATVVASFIAGIW